VLTNVTGVASGKPIVQPYTLLPRTFSATAPDGSKLDVKLNVGIMSFVPPQILEWDQKNLAGKVAVTGVQEAAKQYVPELRSKGADLVVALSHGGLDPSTYSPKMENGSYHLTTTGIDALMIGHSHLIFPKGKETGARRSIHRLPPSRPRQDRRHQRLRQRRADRDGAELGPPPRHHQADAGLHRRQVGGAASQDHGGIARLQVHRRHHQHRRRQQRRAAGRHRTRRHHRLRQAAAGREHRL
jgi:hypothetical protein